MIVCPYCKSDWMQKRGRNKARNKQIYQCQMCRKWFSIFAYDSKKRVPKILLLDIETSPMEVRVWGLYKQRISPDNVIKEWAILSWGAKWLFDSKIMSAVVSTKEATERRDKSLVKELWDLINESDIILAHNGKSFDFRKFNARFILNGLKPPLPYQVIDTLEQSKKYFAFSSYKLDYLNKMFDLQRKIKTTYDLWVRCIKGDASALKEMEEYNRYDVVALEELYVKIRPWIKSHPNLSLYYDTIEEVCPNCGSDKLQWEGFYYTPAGRYRAFRCECGAVGRSRSSDLSKIDREHLLRAIAR